MSKVVYFIHIVALLLIQLLLLDNIQISSYLYLNIYVLAIILAPDDVNDTIVMLLGFAMGAIVDWANDTMGIHIAATTLLAYLRPAILGIVSIRQNNPIRTALRSNNNSWLVKYVALSSAIYFFTLILLEAFSFRGFGLTLLRITCSAVASFIIMMLYYFTAIRSSSKHE